MQETLEIKDIVIKSELIDWQKAQWIQANLKELSKIDYEKLKNSIIKNHFLMPFTVWQDGETIWILDGHHRQKVMQILIADGYKIPEKLPANFIECKDKKDAASKVLVYSSIYAKITYDGLYEFLNINEIKFDEINNIIDLPNISDNVYKENYSQDIEHIPQLNSLESKFDIVVECKNEEEQKKVYEKLINEGLICRILTL